MTDCKRMIGSVDQQLIFASCPDCGTDHLLWFDVDVIKQCENKAEDYKIDLINKAIKESKT